MKKINYILLGLLGLISCEKDDICDGTTANTPKLVIEFYNFDTPTLQKTVVNLKVKGVGMTDYVEINTNGTTTAEKIVLTDVKLKLPLKTDLDFTTFEMSINAISATPSKDIVRFNYIRQEEFVSRACGKRMFFDLRKEGTSPYIINNIQGTASGNWIKNIQIVQPLLTNENEIHLKIFI